MNNTSASSLMRVIALACIALGGTALVACGPSTYQTRVPSLSIMVVPPTPPKKIQIEERIQFERGKARIRTRSHRVLDQVAATLRSRTDIRLVEIQGHTDARGKRSRNLRLSLRRAQAVRAYLVKQGVQESRLVCKGHGPDQPVTTNDTRRGRRENRRVEFIIVRQDTGLVAQDG